MNVGKKKLSQMRQHAPSPRESARLIVEQSKLISIDVVAVKNVAKMVRCFPNLKQFSLPHSVQMKSFVVYQTERLLEF